MARGVSAARAAADATTETTLPRLLAMLSILAGFIPAFFMQGAARSLFVPLALAVGFSMMASYLLSSTLVPVLCVWMLRSQHTGKDGGGNSKRGAGARIVDGYRAMLRPIVALRWIIV